MIDAFSRRLHHDHGDLDEIPVIPYRDSCRGDGMVAFRAVRALADLVEQWTPSKD